MKKYKYFYCSRCRIRLQERGDLRCGQCSNMAKYEKNNVMGHTIAGKKICDLKGLGTYRGKEFKQLNIPSAPYEKKVRAFTKKDAIKFLNCTDWTFRKHIQAKNIRFFFYGGKNLFVIEDILRLKSTQT